MTSSEPQRGRQRPNRTKDTGTVQPARRIAFDVIRAVSDSDAYANLLLPHRLAEARLSPADAGLATELTYGTLRLRGYYDQVIARAANRPVSEIDPAILDVLRLGAHQLLSMRVASHAAVNESVELARSAGSRSAAGFTNGVLRAITRKEPDAWQAEVQGGATTEIDRLAARTAHPSWVVRAIKQSLDLQGRGDELETALEADNLAPQVNFVALPGLSTRPEAATPNRFSPFGFRSGGGDPLGVVTASGGTLRVQDEGSQLAALALTRARPVEPGEQWLDVCAGPGGKAALLAAEALATGAELDANELVPARARLVERAIAPVPLPVVVTTEDGSTIGASRTGHYDRILLDAPCTGLGALRRRPEARWRKTPKDVSQLTKLQGALLDSAIDALAPGGIVAYVTCSPHVGETALIVESALRSHPGLERLDTSAVLDAVTAEPLDAAAPGGAVQLWPHRHGTDAMFIALLQKPFDDAAAR
ncbi:RsmB/NOP family class I SAM-dependent RNA methyltransferase [Plantibacter sp. YIM 135249]|uniref:RsmB/NOP family class I SAM-dependent RNA methyltransferase n=1 Tax=Plantibacter sp. YIM 135249 TaxID=3423918 RepID=UPI003D3280BC